MLNMVIRKSKLLLITAGLIAASLAADGLAAATDEPGEMALDRDKMVQTEDLTEETGPKQCWNTGSGTDALFFGKSGTQIA